MKLPHKIITTFGLVFLSLNALADRTQPYHLCFQPEKPLLLASKYQIDLYQKDLDAYEKCIQKFIMTQEKEIVIHQNAVKEVKLEHQQFVKQHKQ